ncbi:MAG: zinc-dependent metalloprotease [Actinomycetota bacterium]
MDHPAADVDWTMGSAAAQLADWGTAIDVGRRIAGAGPHVSHPDRARMREELGALVVQAETLVTDFTGLEVTGFRSRAWAMGRGDWIRQNLGGLQRVLEPLAQRMIAKRPDRPALARKTMGGEIGAVVGYVSRRVLGQFDVFLPPDDDGLIYFVGPNLVEVEQRFGLSPRDFRLWVSIHEVTHRVQFSSAPWLRAYLLKLVNEYLRSVSLEPGDLMEQLKRAVEQVKGGADVRGPGGLLLLLTPEQREVFERTQGMMSLLEGHASFVMNEVARDHVADLPRMERALKERRSTTGIEKRVQRVIGFDQKVRQYDAGERFVRQVVRQAGQDTLNLVFSAPSALPSSAEIAEPARWLHRVSG